jgi:hypothetical protein
MSLAIYLFKYNDKWDTRGPKPGSLFCWGLLISGVSELFGWLNHAHNTPNHPLAVN